MTSSQATVAPASVAVQCLADGRRSAARSPALSGVVDRMETNPPDKKPTAFRMIRYASIGLELISPIVGGAIAGYYLGEYFKKPWLGLLLLFAGIFVGFYRVFVELRDFQKGL